MYHKIMVPLDGSKLAEAALPHAIFLAKLIGAELIVLSTIVDHADYIIEPYTKADAAKLRDENREKRKVAEEQVHSFIDPVIKQITTENIKTSGVVLHGPPADSIIQYANENDVDLVVMSSHGHSGIRLWLLGSVADKVVRAATVPVLLIRSKATQGC